MLTEAFFSTPARQQPLPRRLAIAAALFGCLLLAGCGWFAERWEWNQKLTVEVSTLEGLRSGSAVSHVSWREANALGNYLADYGGEATVVDMGQGRYLFALIGEETKQIAAHTLHAELGEQRSDYEKLFPKIMIFLGVRDVPREHYPLIVTFTDINDPMTVRKVDPDNLAATFGPGVSLKRITLEITDEAVTKGAVESVTPWLEAVGRGRATLIPNPPRLQKDAADPEIQYLTPGSLSTELYK